MPLSSLILLVALPLQLIACAACAASETALFSLSHGDRVRLRRQLPLISSAVAVLSAQPRSLIISLLLGNAAAVSAYLAVGGVLAKSIKVEWLSIVATFAVPVALIIFGEVLPKAFAGMQPYRSVVLLAIPVSWWHRLIGPLRVILDEYVVAPIARIFRPAGASEEHPLTVDELDELLSASHSRGALDETEQRLLAEVVGLGSLRVRDVMMPRVDITFLPASAEFSHVIASIRDSEQNRLPVSRGDDREDVLGFLNTHAYLSAVERIGTGISVTNYLDPVRYFPERARVDSLLEHFRQTQSHTALVVDERGDVVGMAEIEDAVMPLVRATGSPAAHATDVKKVGKSSWLVSGRVSIRDWETLLVDEFAASGSRVSTLGGLVQLKLGRLAQVGDEVKLSSLRVRVETMDGRSIDTLLLSLEGGNQ